MHEVKQLGGMRDILKFTYTFWDRFRCLLCWQLLWSDTIFCLGTGVPWHSAGGV